MFISRPLSEGTARMNLAISSAAFPAISVRGVLATDTMTVVVEPSLLRLSQSNRMFPFLAHFFNVGKYRNWWQSSSTRVPLGSLPRLNTMWIFAQSLFKSVLLGRHTSSPIPESLCLEFVAPPSHSAQRPQGGLRQSTAFFGTQTPPVGQPPA